jgi:hypothetical protein
MRFELVLEISSAFRADCEESQAMPSSLSKHTLQLRYPVQHSE